MSGKPDSQADIPVPHQGNPSASAASPAPVVPATASSPSGSVAQAENAPHTNNHHNQASHGAHGGKFGQHQGQFSQNYQGKPYNRQNQTSNQQYQNQHPGSIPGQGQIPQQPQGQAQGQGSAPGTPGQQYQQHHQGQRGGNYQNKNYYNKQRNYPPKGNAQGHQQPQQQQQQQQQQFNYYPAYGYYPMYYQAGMMPGGNVPAGYTGQPQQYPQSPVQGFPAGVPTGAAKVKITDKDGKQVNLEDKKNSSASSSASTTPVPAVAQMAAPASKSNTPEAGKSSEAQAAADAAAAAAAARKKEAAEEFRRKILEKAKAAKEKKEQEEKARKAAEEAKASPQLATPAPEQPAQPAVEEPVKEVAKEASAVEEPKTEPVAESKPEPVQEEKAEPVSVPEPQPEPVEAKKEPEVKAEEKSVEPAPAAAEPVAEPAEEKAVEPAAAEEPASEETVAADSADVSTETVPESTETAPTESAEDIEEKDEDADDEESEPTEKVFDLSAFFDRLSTCVSIEDPFTYPYPYPLTGVDARWKAGEKKYRYDPQFLMQFRENVAYPIDDAWKEKLEGLGIVPNRRAGPGGPQRMNSSKFGGSIPSRFGGSMPGRQGQYDGRQNSRSGSKRRGGSSMGNPRDKSMRNRNQSKRGQREREEEAPPKPAEDVKPLVPSANRWVPRSRQQKTEVRTAPDGTILLEKEDVERKIKSALNKLTLEMFEPITEEMLAIAKQSRYEEDAATIKQVISLTFAKACDEPYWSTVYAQFCAKMLKEISDDIKDVNTLTKSGEPATGGDLARRILLATCQSEYEKGWVDKLPTNEDGSPLEPEMMSDEYYAMAAAKRRGLGLVKFIGNLYILNMLNDQVIRHCLRDQSKNVTDPSEDSLENLAQLIKTVGPRFEITDRNKAVLNIIFDNIQLILDNCKLSSRIKFMLMDLQDLKKSNWKSLKQESGPKTIKEIHNEAELKRLEESRANAEKRRSKGGYNSGNYGGGDSRSNSTRGGASWGNKKDSRAPTKDPRGFQSVSRSQSNRPTPDTSFNASHMSPRENSKRTDSMASNIFAALDGDDEEGAGH